MWGEERGLSILSENVRISVMISSKMACVSSVDNLGSLVFK